MPIIRDQKDSNNWFSSNTKEYFSFLILFSNFNSFETWTQEIESKQKDEAFLFPQITREIIPWQFAANYKIAMVEESRKPATKKKEKKERKIEFHPQTKQTRIAARDSKCIKTMWDKRGNIVPLK